MTSVISNSIILVTGINGYIGSHVADQFLTAGYKVRGTVRSLSRVDNIKQALTKKHGKGRLELVEVPYITQDGAFDQAVKGVTVVAHVASIMSFSIKPEKVIPPTIKCVTTILQSCLSEPCIKTFVYTSSSWAAASPKPNVKLHVNSETWNDKVVKKAWAPATGPREDSGFGGSEAGVGFTNNPDFEINAILPATNFGPALHPEEGRSTGGMIMPVWSGNVEAVLAVQPQYYVDVRDAARLHVAAALYPEVKNKRIFAWAYPWNWNLVLVELRKLRPEHKFPEDVPEQGHDLSTVSNEEAEQLLVRMG